MNLTDVFKVKLPADLSRRNIYTDLFKLILPVAIEYALLQLVSMFDQIQVGSLGENAFAAVGIASQVRLIFSTMFTAINIGVTALVAQAVGANDSKETERILEHGLLLSITLSIVLSVFGFLFAEKLLVLFGASYQQTLVLGTAYLKIIMIGLFPFALTTTFTAALRGMGNTKAPLYYNLFANIINIIFNWLLINGNLGFPALGIQGVAIATIIGQSVGFFISWFYCRSSNQGTLFSINNIIQKYDRSQMSRILAIGFPCLVEHLIARIGGSIYTKIVASLGTSLFATHTICLNIQTLTYMSDMIFSVASTTLTGQSLGRKRQDLAVLYSRYCARISFVASLVLIVIYSVFGPALIGLYINDPKIISAGIVPLRIVSIIQPFTAFMYVYSGSLRGAGDTKKVALITVFTMFVVRPTLAYVSINFLNLGLNGAWWALTIEQILTSLLIWLRFTIGKWMHIMPLTLAGMKKSQQG